LRRQVRNPPNADAVLNFLLRTGIDIVVGTHSLQMNHRVQSPGGIGNIVRSGLRHDGRR
jgi:hypothetical protein